MERAKAIAILDKIILASLYIIAFYLPISKAIIESFSIFAIVCFVLKKILERKFIHSTSVNFAVLLYLTICFLSVFISTNLKISARTFFAKILQDILFFWVVVDTLNSEKRIKSFIYIMFFSSMLLGIDGIYQHFTHKDFIRHRKDLSIPRIYATFPTPNDFGSYLVTIMPYLIVCLFTKNRFKIIKFIFLSLSILLLICLMLTVSKGAWLAFMASVLFLGIWIYPVGVFFLFLGLFLIATQPLYPPLMKERLGNFFVVFDGSSLGDAGSIERKIIWQAGWKMFMSNPLSGLGIGTFMFNFKRFVIESYPYGPFYAHNCYLQIAAETGIIGLVSFLVIPVLFFYNGIRMINTGQRDFSWYMLLASLASVLGYAVQMTVDTTFYSLDLGILFWIVLGLGVAVMKNRQVKPHQN